MTELVFLAVAYVVTGLLAILVIGYFWADADADADVGQTVDEGLLFAIGALWPFFLLAAVAFLAVYLATLPYVLMARAVMRLSRRRRRAA